jgi:hypothetical protein
VYKRKRILMSDIKMSQATPTGHRPTPAQRDVSNSATRIVASTFGVLAGLLGIEHGYFETLQGNGAPGGIYILAMGPPCQTNKMWYGCEPAMTIIPHYFVSGVVAIFVSLIVIVWAAAFVQRKHGGLVLILLSILQLLVGGGFVPPILGIIAGVAGTRIHEPFTWWRAHLSVRARRFLAALWPWPLIAFVIWSPGEWIFGYFFNEYLLNLTLITVFLYLGLMLLTVLTAFAHDIQRQADSLLALSMSG